MDSRFLICHASEKKTHATSCVAPSPRLCWEFWWQVLTALGWFHASVSLQVVKAMGIKAALDLSGCGFYRMCCENNLHFWGKCTSELSKTKLPWSLQEVTDHSQMPFTAELCGCRLSKGECNYGNKVVLVRGVLRISDLGFFFFCYMVSEPSIYLWGCHKTGGLWIVGEITRYSSIECAGCSAEPQEWWSPASISSTVIQVLSVEA